MLDAMNTDIVISIIAGSLLFFLLCVFIVAFSALYLRKKQQYKIEKQQLQSQFSQTLLQSQLEIKEQTLQHIGYELHDNLGQVASLIKINLHTIQLDDAVKARQRIEDTKELVRQLITDLKSLSVSLNSDRAAEQGIEKSLETEQERLNKTGQFEVLLEKEGSIPVLDANTTIILYRMAQEILNNMVKHSGAKNIRILLRSEQKSLALIFIDDGVGFDLEEKIKSGGAGLLNLQSRAKILNAQLSIQSVPEKGTTISIQMPL